MKHESKYIIIFGIDTKYERLFVGKMLEMAGPLHRSLDDDNTQQCINC